MNVGNLSEFDKSEKDSADDAAINDQDVQDENAEEYEVISAPVRRTKNMRAQTLSSANKIGRQTDKISVDSMTDLSPLADEAASTSVKTGNTATQKDQDDEA